VKNCPEGALSLSEMGVVTDAGRCTLCGVCADVCPAEARERVGRRVSVDEVFREIERDRLFYEESGGGATFSGGEPLMQPEFLISLLRECRLGGIPTAVDTTGYADPAVLMDVARLTDLFLYDIKQLDGQEHLAAVGIPNGIILDNIRMLTAKGFRVRVRVPLVPGFNDDPVQLKRIGEFVASLPSLDGVSLLPYHTSAEEKYRRFGMRYRMIKITGTSGKSVEALASQLEGYGLDVKIGA
jgi:pyruvate formate lyase activating enzyme